MIKVKFIKTKNDNNEMEIIAVFPDIILKTNFHNGNLLKCFSLNDNFHDIHSGFYKNCKIAKEKEYKILFDKLINITNENYKVIN